MGVMDNFKVILIIMLFYSFSITALAHALPADAKHYAFNDFKGDNLPEIEEVGEDIESSIQQQTDIPIIELGALVFYSGNILIDLLLNFAFAIPEMVGLVLRGILMLLGGVDVILIGIVQLFVAVALGVMYFLMVMEAITNIRTGRVV